MFPTRTQVLKYTLLPGFIPRIFTLFSSGFAHTAYIIAVIYQSLGLLPANHPYIDPQNFGRFGIRHVIAEAANNLVFSRKNLDQIVIFFTILIGMVLLLMQFALLIVALIAQQPALAAVALTPNNILSVTSALGHGGGTGPAQDITFMILDRVFGLQGFFNSCVSTATPCEDLEGNPMLATGAYPTGFHLALHSLLRFYSLGIFCAGVFIILYFCITIVAETASTGTPFGQRMNKTWAPIRLIMFFALLLPLNIGAQDAGFNAGQLLTLATAKTGSNFATNAWGHFNNSLAAGTTAVGDPIRLVGAPTVPELAPLVKFMFLAKTCKIAEEIVYHNTHWKTGGTPAGIQAYIVRPPDPVPVPPGYVPEPASPNLFLATSFANAVRYSSMGNITVRFGTYNPGSEKHRRQWTNIFPVCGQIVIPVTKMDRTGDPASGAYAVQALYYRLLQEMWNDPDITSYAECIVRKTVPRAQERPDCTMIPDSAFAESQIAQYQNSAKLSVGPLVDQQINNSTWNISAQVKAKGWAGAAIWYNRLAQINGELATAIYAQPSVTLYPDLLEHVAKQRKAQNADDRGVTMFDPILANGANIKYRKTADTEIIAPMQLAVSFFQDKAREKEKGQGIFIDTINIIFGTSGIFNMRENDDIHPLAQLSSLGKSMMEASIRNVALGYLGDGASQLLPGFTGPIAQVGSATLKTIGTATMAMSFILFYILPLMPFIYFFFAMSGWIKSIFEAIVAMPLWALAHIVRIDGNGLPGPAATNGYFLLLEIFVRPILIVFGLIGSIVIFSSIVHTLNGTFKMVVDVSGFDRATEISGTLPSAIEFMRGPIDEFFYTCVYVILCYTVGLSCFKLIDLIPAKILRYMGVTVAAFQENAGDPAGDVLKKTYSGSMLATGQLKGGQLAAIM